MSWTIDRRRSIWGHQPMVRSRRRQNNTMRLAMMRLNAIIPTATGKENAHPTKGLSSVATHRADHAETDGHRKHEARHRKLYKCDQPNCSRKQGFGTINDLARHKKCVHKQEPERGPKILYLCFGRDCPRRHKRWPRLDNFRQHLLRMHGDEDADELLKR
jgi:hypothetical protein